MSSRSSRPSQHVLKVAVSVPLPLLFDYLPRNGEPFPESGSRVLVRFGPRKLVGVVVRSAGQSDVSPGRLQTILRTLDEGRPALSRELLALLEWCAAYYKHPVGEVIFNALPPDLRKAGGVIPGPPEQICITDSGQARVADPPGRAVAQFRLLERLAVEPLVMNELRQQPEYESRLLKRLLENKWVERQAVSANRPALKPGPALTGEQQAALAGIEVDLESYNCHLLDGITGSGKTEVYMHLLSQVLLAGRQVLVLVPEIGLTPQLLRRFSDRLGIQPLVSHSGIAAGGRMAAWSGALSGKAQLLLGTRSALFLPLVKPGLIIMDESHDPSFKQQEGFRYSARDVAVKRASELGIPIVLGSATPSLESLHNAEGGRYQRHRLRHRATGAAEPAWRVLDLRQQATHSGLSSPALKSMKEVLGRGEQVLVFLNRRGYAPVLLCHSCGWHAGCPRCDANMTWHRAGRQLVCHHCDQARDVPDLCPDCSADALQGAGEGTEQLEKWLQGRFPEHPLYRVDRDRMRRKGELEQVVANVRGGEPCILVGTQMLAKGHHFPKVTLVVVVNLDQALYSADFRALERMGQVLVQVAGRAGREDRAGTVVLQTHHPDHSSLQTLIQHGYAAFARDLLADRRLAGLPPFTFQATLRAEESDRERVLAFLKRAARDWAEEGGSLHGPFPAMMERRGGRYRWYLLVQNTSRAALQAALGEWLAQVRELPEARRVRWTVDVDPQEF